MELELLQVQFKKKRKKEKSLRFKSFVLHGTTSSATPVSFTKNYGVHTRSPLRSRAVHMWQEKPSNKKLN